MGVSSLGYVGLSVSDPAAWEAFACQRLGLMSAGTQDGVTRLRLDSRAWRIALHQGSEDDLAYAGFEVDSIEALCELEQGLAAAGFPVKRGDDELLAARQVQQMIITEDPGGIPIELYCGLMDRGNVPFASPAGTSAFVTGEQGLGHFVVSAPDRERFYAFYCDVLGMKLSDKIQMGPLALEFFHCNPRHHTVAMAPVPFPKRIHHLMFEVQNIDDVGFALDRCEQAGDTISTTLGKHSNDQMVSFYVKSPAGFDVEYGYGAIAVDDATWRIGHYDKMSIWGHKGL